MDDILLLAAFAVAFVYSIIQCIPIYFPEPRVAVVRRAPVAPPTPGVWDSICDAASFVWHASPYVLGGCLGLFALAYVVGFISDFFETKRNEEEARRKEVDQKLQELLTEIAELKARRWQLADAIAPISFKLSELEGRITALEPKESGNQGQEISQPPAEPHPKTDTAIKGQIAVARVLQQMGRGY